MLQLFSKAGDVRRVTIAKKKDMKNPGGCVVVVTQLAVKPLWLLPKLERRCLKGRSLRRLFYVYVGK